MIKLISLLKGQPYQSSVSLDEALITGVSFKADSVEPGHLFIVTKPLGSTDIHAHIQKAIEKGATYLLKDRDLVISSSLASSIPVIEVKSAQGARARIAVNLFPGQPEKIVAVTGTNGKTSVTHFLQQLWSHMGHKAVCMGTAGMYGNIDLEGFPKTELTSPNSLHLHWALSTLKDRACTHVALEASSHGLDQRRMDCLDLAAAGYTNLTHEHLDYHKNMDTYFEAKSRLFTDLLTEGSGVVLNADDFRYPSLLAKCRERGHRIISYGRQTHDIQLLNIELNEDGQELDLRVFGRHYKTPLPLVGAIQSYNVMCAIGLAIASGSSEEEVMKALPYLKSVPGRFEWVGTLKNKAKIFVDYAHTPDALETLLTSIRPHVKGIIHLVFGCGGDRDTKKRPMMGELADKLAEKVYITDDNPRSEVPSAIRKEIHAACPTAIEIGDRREAIMTALAKCSDHDVCIIAGKGHEQGQIIGTDVLPFDDRLVAQEEIMRLKGTLA